MSSSLVSFVLASFCEDKNIRLCFWVASSSALMDRCRPTKSGTTIWGKTIMSLNGSRGTRVAPDSGSLSSFLSFRNSITVPLLSALCGLGVYDDRRFMSFHDILGYHHFFDVRL